MVKVLFFASGSAAKLHRRIGEDIGQGGLKRKHVSGANVSRTETGILKNSENVETRRIRKYCRNREV